MALAGASVWMGAEAGVGAVMVVRGERLLRAAKREQREPYVTSYSPEWR
jgi:hypothetical protein